MSDYQEEQDTKLAERKEAFLRLPRPITLTTYEDGISSSLDWRRSQISLAREAHLERDFRSSYENGKHCLSAAAAVAGWIQNLEQRKPFYRIKNQQNPIRPSPAKDLTLLINVAISGNLEEWGKLWSSRTAPVIDLIGSVRRSREIVMCAARKLTPTSEITAALRPNAPVPEGWMRGPNGFLIETPESVLPLLHDVRAIAARAGRRTHWFEKLVLHELASWLSILTESRVGQPSYDGLRRRGPIMEFLNLIESVCGDETLFFQSLRSSGRHFGCFGPKGVLRVIE